MIGEVEGWLDMTLGDEAIHHPVAGGGGGRV